MAIKVNNTTVIDDTRVLNNIAGLDQTSKNNIPGFKLVTDTSGQNVSGVWVALNSAANIHYIIAELSEATAANFNMAVALQNSSGTTINVAYRTTSNSTTNTYFSNNSPSTALNYWDMGSVNSTTYAGQRLITACYVHSPQVTSLPFDTPMLYGTSTWFDTSSNSCIANYSARALTTNGPVGRVFFSAQSGNLGFYRVKVYSVGV